MHERRTYQLRTDEDGPSQTVNTCLTETTAPSPPRRSFTGALDASPTE